MVYNCEFVTFPFVSWVRCGTWLYRFLIFASLLTLTFKLWNYSKDALMKIYSYIYSLRKLQNNQGRTMIFAKYKTNHLFGNIPQVSKLFWVNSEPTQKLFWLEKESSKEFRIFLQGSRTFNDELFLNSRWFFLEKSYDL